MDKLKFTSVGVRTCNRCGIEKPIASFDLVFDKTPRRLRDCTMCRRARQRANKAKKYREDPVERARRRVQKDRPYNDQARAGSKVNHAIKMGRLVRPTRCEKCGTEGRIQAHHEDYSRPLDVLWLCVSCHHERHRAPSPDPGGGQ